MSGFAWTQDDLDRWWDARLALFEAEAALLLSAAGSGNSQVLAEALVELCDEYSAPLYLRGSAA